MDTHEQIDALNAEAWRLRRSDVLHGIELSQQAGQLAKQQLPPYMYGFIASLRTLAALYARMPRYDEALDAAHQALDLVQQYQNDNLQAEIFHVLGNLYLQIGNFPDGLSYLIRACNQSAQMGYKSLEAAATNSIALAYQLMEDYTTAQHYLTLGYGLAKEIKDCAEQADALATFCVVYNKLGDSTRALECGRQSIALYRELGNRRGEAEALTSLGRVYVTRRQYAESLACFENCLHIARSTKHTNQECETLIEIGKVYAAEKDYDQGVTILLQALRIADGNRSMQLQVICHEALVNAYKKLGEFEKALSHYERFHQYKEAIFSEQSDLRLKSLHVTHEVETVRIEAEVNHLENVELQWEIRERQRAEEALQVVNEQLRLEIEQRERLIAELDAYAHTVAHDLKNPINLMIGYVDLLDFELSSILRDDQRMLLAGISEGVMKLNQIVDELLVMASLQRDDIDMQPLDMASIIHEAEKRLFVTFQEKQGTLEVVTDLPLAMGHAPWVEEVWVNYLSNAVKYGGSPPIVTVGADAPENGVVRYWVQDNGDGLSREGMARIFQIFARADENKHLAKGHGLGLSIVSRIITKLGGTVSVQSDHAPGQGCIFSFTLPVV